MTSACTKYSEWFTKHSGTQHGNVQLFVSPDDNGNSYVFTYTAGGKKYKAKIWAISAVSADGKTSLPAFTKESEVDAEVAGYTHHAVNLLNI